MRLTLTFLVTLFLSFSSKAQDWETAKRHQTRWVMINGKYGLVHPHYPNLLSETLYDKISWLGEDNFLVKSGFKFKQAGKWGVLDVNGKIIIKAEYDAITFTDRRLYKAVKGGVAQLFDEYGNPR